MGVQVYREGEREERGEVTLNEAAAALQVSAMTVLRMIRSGILPARHLCKGAPWVIKAENLGNAVVRAEAQDRRRKPLTENLDQQTLIFQ
jgi:excisionase family DNA binding protein